MATLIGGVELYPAQYVGVEAADTSILSWKGDLLAIAVFDDALEKTEDSQGKKAFKIKNAELKNLDTELGGLLSELIDLNKFSGKSGSSAFARFGGSARVVGLVGLGSAAKAAPVKEYGTSVYQALGDAVASAAKAHKAKSAAVAFPAGVAAVPAEHQADAGARVAAGLSLGAYEATRFKSGESKQEKASPLESVQLLGLTNGADLSAALSKSLALAKGTILARYLVEAPPNICTPQYLADVAAAIQSEHSDVLKLEVLEREECEALGMGCYLGVSECSAFPPKFIHITYTPTSGEVKKKVAIVGKGLTFDSGGYNLKTGAGIEMMKFDMGGAGATLGAAKSIGQIKPEGVEIHFISAVCENMIDGKGMRPGDILTASNGKTVEVNNTDAEGRLTLADALGFAQKQCGATAIVDIATLTGACMVALGQGIAGVFTPSDDLAASLAAASASTGEKLWRMPMEDSYLEIMKSPIADLKNAGSRYAGAITAALFLREFVDTETVDWAHIDIAGPAWDDKLGGATGFGAQTLAAWAISQGK